MKRLVVMVLSTVALAFAPTAAAQAGQSRSVHWVCDVSDGGPGDVRHHRGGFPSRRRHGEYHSGHDVP